MTKKRLTWLTLMLATMISSANAETTSETDTEAFALTEPAVEEVAEVQDAQQQSGVKLPQWVQNIKFSGYGMIQYQAEDKEGGDHNEFNLRLLRLILDGKIGDWAWRVQGQGSANAGPGNATFNLVDLFAEWQKYDEFRVKVGQFKRAFSFENPTHPITQGWYAYAMVINNLVGFGDRTGEKSSGGRDIGIQVQGDLLPNANGRKLLHYQIGVYNGEGINKKDANTQKDVIGGLWVMPVEGLRIGAFGWTGRCEAVGKKNRYAISAEWDKNDYTFRTEYIHSQGYGSDLSWGDKADGFYAFGIVPLISKKLYGKARYNLYRRDKTWGNSKTMYEVGLNYLFTPRLQLNAEYARVNDRTIANPDKHNYNFVDVQLDFRF